MRRKRERARLRRAGRVFCLRNPARLRQAGRICKRIALPPSGEGGVPSRLHGSTCFGGRHHAPWARSAASPRAGVESGTIATEGRACAAACRAAAARRATNLRSPGAGPCRGAACAGHRSGHRGGRRALRGVRAPPALHGDVGFPVRAARDAHGGALRRVVIPPGAPWRFHVAVGDPSGIPLRSGGGDSGASDAGRPALRRDAPRCRSSPSPRRPAIRRASSSARRSGAPPFPRRTPQDRRNRAIPMAGSGRP